MPVVQQIIPVMGLTIGAHDHLAFSKLSDDMPDGVHGRGAEIKGDGNGYHVVDRPVDFVKISEGLPDLRKYRFVCMREYTA
jgi:hypothetical protein